jgi:hypothetical protein
MCIRDSIKNERYASIYGNKGECADKDKVVNKCGATIPSGRNNKTQTQNYCIVQNNNLQLVTNSQENISHAIVFNSSGQIINQTQNINRCANNTILHNINRFAPGIYFVILRSVNNTYTQKVLF